MLTVMDIIVCEKGILKVFKAAGYIVMVVKIIVPIVLLVMGIIDLFQAILGSELNQMTISIKAFIQRIIGGIIIFFLPTLVYIVLGFISGGKDFVEDKSNEGFGKCNECLYHPSDCVVDDDWMSNVEDKVDEP